MTLNGPIAVTLLYLVQNGSFQSQLREILWSQRPGIVNEKNVARTVWFGKYVIYGDDARYLCGIWVSCFTSNALISKLGDRAARQKYQNVRAYAKLDKLLRHLTASSLVFYGVKKCTISTRCSAPITFMSLSFRIAAIYLKSKTKK